METATLGRSGISIPRVGFGCDQMGGHGWGEVDSAEIADAIEFAFEQETPFFETADCYGLGQSETFLGEALKGRRDKAIVATKFGIRFFDGVRRDDTSPEWIRTAVEASLKRLQTDRIDIYQMHYWDGRTPLDDVCDVLTRLVEQGKIRAWGASNTKRIGSALAKRAKSSLASFSFEFSLARRHNEPDIRRIARETGATFLSWGSLGQGILTGKYGADHKFSPNDRRARAAYVNFSEEGRRRNQRIVEAMKAVQRRYPERTLAQIALRWILDYLPNSAVLVGVKRRGQLADSLGALGWRLAPADISLLNSVSEPQAIPEVETQ